MAKKEILGENNSIWGIEASRILGISKPTFATRIFKGIYKVNCIQCRKGFRYSIRDVFRIAHPRVSDRQIEGLIMDYRLKIASMRKKRQTRKAGVK